MINRVVSIVMIVLVVILALNIAQADGERKTAFVICNPEGGRVNIRCCPKRSGGGVIGYLECGEEIILTGRKSGHWVEIVANTEMEFGWVNDGYIVYSPVTVETVQGKVTAKKVHARKSVGGDIAKTLKKGSTVTVYAFCREWVVTNRGYIMAEFVDLN